MRNNKIKGLEQRINYLENKCNKQIRFNWSFIGRLFAFFSKEPYEEMIVNYKGELYGVMERVGEVHYLKYLNI